ncbi:enoyl-CoA hydratase/isomerase family protein [Kribbella sp. NPDC051586]|uniref:enoyl-CoA hydratase/isomerase family protein n=1 Tax=Kribbella sp. NPDC051586 TaxID=3364118 RepID=UPI00379E4AC3
MTFTVRAGRRVAMALEDGKVAQTLKDWQAQVGRFVAQPRLEDYAEQYAEFCVLDRHDGILEARLHSDGGSVTVHDPEWYAVHNAWGRLWQEVGRDPENEVLILTGSGSDWFRPSAPTVQEQNESLHSLQRPPDHAYEHAYHDGTKLVENFVFNIDIPTIAAVNGPSAAHTEFALMCDLTLAAETATFMDPHFLVGVVPGDGQQLAFQELLGAKRAAYHLYTGQPIDARTALELGLVNEVVAPADLMPRARELAAMIMERPRTARRLTHAVIQRPWKRRLVDDLGYGMAHEMFAIAAARSS